MNPDDQPKKKPSKPTKPATPDAPAVDKRSARERAYDAEIAPLMTKVLDACRRHQIPVAAQFSIGPAPDGDPSWLCSSVLTFGDVQIARVAHAMKVPLKV